MQEVRSLDVAAVARRTLIVVVVSQVLGGAGLSAGVSVGALLAKDMLGSDALTGLPAALSPTPFFRFASYWQFGLPAAAIFLLAVTAVRRRYRR